MNNRNGWKHNTKAGKGSFIRSKPKDERTVNIKKRPDRIKPARPLVKKLTVLFF